MYPRISESAKLMSQRVADALRNVSSRALFAASNTQGQRQHAEFRAEELTVIGLLYLRAVLLARNPAHETAARAR